MSEDEVIGLHPLRSGRSSAKPAEHSNDDSEGPLALWAQWQRGQPPADTQSAPGLSQLAEPPNPAPHQASVRLGQCFVAWAPGLLGSLLQSFGLSAAQSSSSAAAAGDSFAQSASGSPAKLGIEAEPSQLQTEAESGQRQIQDEQQRAGSWLAAYLVADLSVGSLQVLPHTCTCPPCPCPAASSVGTQLQMQANLDALCGLQLAALASSGAETEALLLTVPKLTWRLGPVKAAAAGGTSVTSDMLRLHTSAASLSGLRCAP